MKISKGTYSLFTNLSDLKKKEQLSKHTLLCHSMFTVVPLPVLPLSPNVVKTFASCSPKHTWEAGPLQKAALPRTT